MNDNKYQELLTKTASYDPATMLLYKVAAVSYAFKGIDPLLTKVAPGVVIDPAKKTVKEIVRNVLNKLTGSVANNAAKLGDSAQGLSKAIKGRMDPLVRGELGAPVRKQFNKDILKNLAALLKNPLTIGAGVGVAGTGAAGAVGYDAYKKSKG